MSTIEEIPLTSIRTGHNARNRFDAAQLRSLSRSIETEGLVQPITVRPHPDGTGYELVAGERRYRAHETLGLSTIRCIIRNDFDEEHRFAAMLVENTGRADLRPMEEARAYRDGRDLYGWDVAETARRAGVAEFRVKWRLSLLSLSDRIAALVDNGDLPTGYARAMTGLDHNRQHVALSSYVAHPGITLTQFEAVCLRLQADQDQEGLFDTGEFLTNETYDLDKVKVDANRARPSRAQLVALVHRLTEALDATGDGDPSLVADGQAVER